MAEPIKAIVIGGGIGGLAAALALHRAGVEVVVFERASELREVAAGIVLWPNAIRVMHALGLGDSLRAMGVAQHSLGLYSRRGWRLAGFTGEMMVQRYGSPVIVAHRVELLNLLQNALPAGTVQLKQVFTGLMQKEKEVRALFGAAQKEVGHLLIGADGLYSMVREQIVGAKQPRYGGYTIWRAVVRFDARKITSGETWGRGLRFGQYVMSHGRVYWYATRSVPEGQDQERVERRKELLELFKDWHKPITELIETTEERAIMRNDTYDRQPLDRWCAGRATLMGDAAHPMTPDLGQGACLALEDAVALADCVQAKPKDLPGALRDYEGLRLIRTTRMVLESRRVAAVASQSNPWVCTLRHAYMRTPLFRNNLLGQWDQLLGKADGGNGKSAAPGPQQVAVAK